jgi:hypothetical protein
MLSAGLIETPPGKPEKLRLSGEHEESYLAPSFSYLNRFSEMNRWIYMDTGPFCQADDVEHDKQRNTSGSVSVQMLIAASYGLLRPEVLADALECISRYSF